MNLFLSPAQNPFYALVAQVSDCRSLSFILKPGNINSQRNVQQDNYIEICGNTWQTKKASSKGVQIWYDCYETEEKLTLSRSYSKDQMYICNNIVIWAYVAVTNKIVRLQRLKFI